MAESTFNAVYGGLLIGGSAVLLLLFNGKIAGISGIVFGAFSQKDKAWRWLFVLGLLAGGSLAHRVLDIPIPSLENKNLLLASIAGLLVGFGVRKGNGCTSGHGVCGLGRLSKRSLAATLTFLIAGIASASLIGLLTG